MEHLIDTYWNSKGEQQEKYTEMCKAGWIDWGTTKASQADMHRYYRYYNDGDLPGWARGRWDLKVWSPLYHQWILNTKGEQELENRATEIVLKEYKRFQKAKERGEIF